MALKCGYQNMGGGQMNVARLYITIFHSMTPDYVLFLQSKKGGAGDTHEAEEAESLLLTNKPLTDLTSLLTQLVRTGRLTNSWLVMRGSHANH